MTTYGEVTVTGYNASPPPDDGTEDSTNEISWEGIKTKLTDPLKTAIDITQAAITIAVDGLEAGKISSAGHTAASVVGRSANSSGAVADIAAASNDTFLQRVSNALAWGTLTIGMVPDALLTFAKLATAAIASQAEAIAGTASTVLLTPQRGTQLVTAHQAAAKAWGRVTYSGGTPTLVDSFNVASITDTAQGQLTVTFTTAMGNALYAAVASSYFSGGGTAIRVSGVGSQSTGSFRIDTVGGSGTLADPDSINFVVFGD